MSDMLIKLHWEILFHRPSSSELTPCDLDLFGPLKKALRGTILEDDEGVQNFVYN